MRIALAFLILHACANLGFAQYIDWWDRSPSHGGGDFCQDSAWYVYNGTATVVIFADCEPGEDQHPLA